MARPRTRKGVYVQINLDVRQDLLERLDRQPESRRVFIEHLLESRFTDMTPLEKYLSNVPHDKMIATAKHQIAMTLDSYLLSDDFKSGVISSTRASWGGSGYSVELLPDGTWQNLWNNQIGNLYESAGVMLRLPALDTDDMSEYVDGGAGSEDDYLSEAFFNEENELANELRRALAE